MKRTLKTLPLIAPAALAAVMACGLAAPALAQATRTWIAGDGDDGNPCSRTAPCRTLQVAYNRTASSGFINVLTNGYVGPITITKPISIMGGGPGASNIMTSGTGIQVSAGPNDVVRIEGVSITTLGTGTAGISFKSGAAMHVDNVLVYAFAGGPGLIVAPASGAAEIYVSNLTVDDTPNNPGVMIQPTGTGTVTAIFDGLTLNNNANGILVDSSASTGAAGVVAVIQNSLISEGSYGVSAVSAPGAGPSSVFLDHTTVDTNVLGVVTSATGTPTVRISASVITGAQQFTLAPGVLGNGTANSETQILSYRTNAFQGNANGAAPAVNVNYGQINQK